MSKALVTTCLLLLLAAAHAAAGRRADAQTRYRLSLPGKDWALDLTLPAVDAPPAGVFAPPVEYLSDDGREFRLTFFANSLGKGRKELLLLDIALGPARAAGGGEDFRAYALKRLSKGVTVEGLKTWEYKQFALARYRVDLTSDLGGLLPGSAAAFAEGVRTAHAFLVKDGVWVSLRLSSREFGDREEGFFRALLDSAVFADTSAPSSSFDYFHKGRLLYLSKDYRGAAGALAAALALEQKERRLDAASWRVMVSNLADSYAAAGEDARAKMVLDYGAQGDPSYTPFQLALARFYAKQGDLDNVIAYLEKAFLTPPGAGVPPRLPDPERDPAFQRFRKDEKFRRALKALKRHRPAS
ncbi:MAG TPA: hypothetical protein VF736_01075 [Pyrinomonadaceae bacterium]